MFLLWVNGCDLPDPSERVTDVPSPATSNAMYRPSGLHSGAKAFPVKVKPRHRVSLPVVGPDVRARSFRHLQASRCPSGGHAKDARRGRFG